MVFFLSKNEYCFFFHFRFLGVFFIKSTKPTSEHIDNEFQPCMENRNIVMMLPHFLITFYAIFRIIIIRMLIRCVQNDYFLGSDIRSIMVL